LVVPSELSFSCVASKTDTTTIDEQKWLTNYSVAICISLVATTVPTKEIKIVKIFYIKI